MRKMSLEWLKAASDDLLVIERILDKESLSHIVAFHSQQAIEKSLKAIIEEKEIEIPKIHKLKTLFSKIDVNFNEVYDDELIKLLDSLYIESRYPGDMGLLPNAKPTLEEAKEFYKFAMDIFNKVCDILGIALSDLKM